MQLLPPPPAQAPTPPTPAGAPVAQTAPARPLTASEVDAIRTRRSELSDQLASAAGRREELAEQLQTAEGQSRVGLEQRMAVLDKRIVQLESDMAETGQMLTSSQYTSETQPSVGTLGLSAEQTTAVSIVFTLFVLFPLALAAARLMWKRATHRGGPPDNADVTRRLINLEHSIDAVAVEIERVSEGQRYVTKLFTEARGTPALGAGQAPAEPMRVGHEERVGIPSKDR